VEPSAGGRDDTRPRGDLAAARLRSDYKTIADYRRDNHSVFKAVFRAFIILCRKLDLFGLAMDGTRLKAVNNPGRNFSRR
jgi:transposase